MPVQDVTCLDSGTCNWCLSVNHLQGWSRHGPRNCVCGVPAIPCVSTEVQPQLLPVRQVLVGETVASLGSALADHTGASCCCLHA